MPVAQETGKEVYIGTPHAILQESQDHQTKPSDKPQRAPSSPLREEEKPTLLSFPDEILLQILSYNTPSTLTSRQQLITHIRRAAVTKRFYRLSRDAFFHSFTHVLDLSCVLSKISRAKFYTQICTQGVLVGRQPFVAKIRRLEVRVHVYYPESVGKAVEELERLLKGYISVGLVKVGVSTASRAVGMEMEMSVRGVLGGMGVRRWSVDVFVGGCRMSEG